MENKSQELATRGWAAKKYGVKIEEVVAYFSGSCYDRIIVANKRNADKISKAVDGRTANGGFFHDMPLGGIRKVQGGFEVTC